MKKERIKLAAILILIGSSLIMTSCGGIKGAAVGSKEDLMESVNNDISLEEADVESGLANGAAKDVLEFSMALFEENLRPGENVLVSPISALYALSMVSNGADGQTKEELLSILTEGSYAAQIDADAEADKTQQRLNEYLRAYLNAVKQRYDYSKEMAELYNDDKNYKPAELHIANSIWIKDDPSLTVEDEFLQVNGKYYNAGIRKTAFDNSAAKTMSKWIEDNTGGTIKDMITEIPDNAIMYLINAMAFEAKWAEVYEDYQVHDDVFHGESGDSDASFMSGAEFEYLEDDKSTGFIKYYDGYGYAFVAILPNEDVTVDEYIGDLTSERLGELLKNPIEHEVIATMPKFESKSELNLKESFLNMGMNTPFDMEAADFSKLGTYEGENIFISNILQNTFIEVNETGTKAGAATVVEMAAEGAFEEPEPPKYVTLDRPFIYMLIDAKEDIPLFMGVIRNL